MSAPNKDLGPCSVLWDQAGDNLELNPTFGGVTFRDEVQKVDILEDQQGVTPVDAVHVGRIVEVTVPMTRSTLDALEHAIMGSVETGTTMKVSNKVGDAVFANAKELVIKPIVDGVAAPASTWLHIHRCYPFSALEWVYDVAGQRVTNVVFQAYPDDKTGKVNEMWRLGAQA